MAADQKGFFKEAGIKYEPVYTDSGPAQLQALIKGDLKVSTGSPPVFFAAINNGACIRVLRPMEGAEYNLIAQKSLGLNPNLPYPEVMQQLKGKVLGVPARGGPIEAVFKKFMTDAGLNPETDATFIAMGSGAPATTSFSTGRVDATLSTAALETSLNKGAGFDVLLPLLGKTDGPLKDLYQAMVIANCEWVDKNPELVQKFCHALNQGYSALNSDPTAGPNALVALQVAPSPTEATAVWEQYKAPMVSIPELTEDTWKKQGEFAPPNVPVPDFAKHVVSGCATA